MGGRVSGKPQRGDQSYGGYGFDRCFLHIYCYLSVLIGVSAIAQDLKSLP